MKPIYLRNIPNYCKKQFEKEMFYKKFGHLRVLGISDKTDSTNVHFVICICDCGNLFHTRKCSVLHGRTKSCCGYVSLDEEKERFNKGFVANENGCWIWNSGKYIRPNGKDSYGRFESKLFTGEYLAHRLSFLFFKGKIPDQMYICHLCDVQSCVNPDHLFLGTHRVNTLDTLVKERTLCGEKNHKSTYKVKDIQNILALRQSGLSYSEIHKKTGFSKTQIAGVIKGKRWKHITN